MAQALLATHLPRKLRGGTHIVRVLLHGFDEGGVAAQSACIGG